MIKQAKPPVALALLEFESIAAGIHAADRMIKKAPISLLRCGTVHPGRYLILVGGSVASTDEAFREGLAAGSTSDAIFLPDPHEDLRNAVRERPAGPGPESALGIVETASSPALLRAVDPALKATSVALAELRLSDDLGGHGFALLHGELSDVEAALDAATRSATAGERAVVTTALLSRLDGDLAGLLGEGTTFRECAIHEPAGAESPIPPNGGE